MFVQAVGLAQDAFKVVPVHCFLKFLLETETPILFSDYQLMGHNGKRGVKDILIQTSLQKTIIQLLFYFKLFFFWGK
jgi:hypothetical protein